MTETNTKAQGRDDVLVDQVRRSLRRVSGVAIPEVERYGPTAVEFADRQEEAIGREVEKFRSLLAETNEVVA